MPREKEPFGQEDEKPKKQELPKSAPEKRENTLDTEYHVAVSKYFNKRKIESAKPAEKQTEDDAMLDGFLSEQKATLEKMANAKRLEKMQPKDVSFALSEVAGTMGIFNVESGHVNYLYTKQPEFEVADEQHYLEAEEVFMESCEKIFPETVAKNITATIEEIIEKIDAIDVGGMPTLELSDHEALLKDDPQKLLENINNFLYFAGTSLKETAFNKYVAFFNNEIKTDRGDDSLATTEEKLAIGVEAIYKLQLIKNQLIEKLYGGKNTTPSERRKINKLKSGI